MRRVIILLIITLYSLVASAQINADHSVVELYDDIPQQWIDSVKKMWLSYPGESHSEGIRAGLLALEAFDPTYAVSVIESGTPEAYTALNLRASRATWGDYNNETGWIYSYGEEDWFINEIAIERTKAGIAYCNSHDLTIGAFGFGWCWDESFTDMTDYIAATKSYIDYCANSIDTKILFTTGPVDDINASGETGYLKYLAYETIRDTVDNDPTRILFDYADILCYDSGNETPNTTTWNGHLYPIITETNLIPIVGSYHISEAGALRLGKAMWWMLARIAGWDGGSTIIIDNKMNPEFYIVQLQNKLTIKSEKHFVGLSKCSLYSLNGSLLYKEKIVSNSIDIDISSLTSGIYIITFTGLEHVISLKVAIP